MTDTKQKSNICPPSNTLRVEAWRDLPIDASPALYRVTEQSGNARIIRVSKGCRVVLDALIRQPVLCASPVRISQYVGILIHEHGVQIRTEVFANDAATGRARFGVYFLDAIVERVHDNAEAA